MRKTRRKRAIVNLLLMRAVILMEAAQVRTVIVVGPIRNRDLMSKTGRMMINDQFNIIIEVS